MRIIRFSELNPEDVVLESASANAENKERIDIAMMDLTEREREIIEMRFYDKKTFKEIGIAFNRSVEAVRRVYLKARCKMIRKINKLERHEEHIKNFERNEFKYFNKEETGRMICHLKRHDR
ncbi:MAG TPA: hypothetical protein DDY86_04040 [Syntrophaceae bacterium]|nr:hypothetical protein [Syntrophaceae bacterium]